MPWHFTWNNLSRQCSPFSSLLSFPFPPYKTLVFRRDSLTIFSLRLVHVANGGVEHAVNVWAVCMCVHATNLSLALLGGGASWSKECCSTEEQNKSHDFTLSHDHHATPTHRAVFFSRLVSGPPCAGDSSQTWGTVTVQYKLHSTV